MRNGSHNYRATSFLIRMSYCQKINILWFLCVSCMSWMYKMLSKFGPCISIVLKKSSPTFFNVDIQFALISKHECTWNHPSIPQIFKYCMLKHYNVFYFFTFIAIIYFLAAECLNPSWREVFWWSTTVAAWNPVYAAQRAIIIEAWNNLKLFTHWLTHLATQGCCYLELLEKILGWQHILTNNTCMPVFPHLPRGYWLPNLYVHRG